MSWQLRTWRCIAVLLWLSGDQLFSIQAYLLRHRTANSHLIRRHRTANSNQFTPALSSYCQFTPTRLMINAIGIFIMALQYFVYKALSLLSCPGSKKPLYSLISAISLYHYSLYSTEKLLPASHNFLSIVVFLWTTHFFD